MSESTPAYGKPFVPADLMLGDKVEVLAVSVWNTKYVGKIGTIVAFRYDGRAVVAFQDAGMVTFPVDDLRKVKDTIKFTDKDVPNTEVGSDNVVMFRHIVEQLFETYKRKNADYGDAYERGYKLFGYNQLLSRIYEKFCRVHHLLNSGEPSQVDEAIEDTLSDMATQCICLRILFVNNNIPTVDFEDVK